jgi:D-inositol-3-phosphate glycosyltransferase
MGSALFHLRRLLGGTFKLLYCNGAPSPPVHYHHRCDFAQILTDPDLAEARSFGIPQRQLFAVPYGVDAELFHPDQKRKRDSIRQEIGVPLGAKLILSVAALKAEHKRIDYLIRELSALPTNVWLVVAGQRTTETAHLEAMAETLIPGRWRFVSWPHARVAELYGAADRFALCSLTEAFGLVTIEAMLSELPVIIHDGPIFKWLANGTSTQLIDMSRPGELTSALLRNIQCAATCEQLNSLKLARQAACSRFSWQALIPQYLEMYLTAAAS